MPLDDTTLRPVPSDQIFPDEDVRLELLNAITGEIRERGEGDGDPGAFALLDATRRALARLRQVEEQADGGHTHALLLFHAWHIGAREGRHFLVSTPVCRWAVEAHRGDETGEPAGTGEGPTGVPAGTGEAADPGESDDPGDAGAAQGAGDDLSGGLPAACYLQLPHHLFWVRETEDERPRSLDGLFWTRTGETLHLLGVVDPQAVDDGVEVLPLPGVPLADREVWLAESMREEGEDFRSSIPGAELENLYELRTAGELLKLAARIDRYRRLFPTAVETRPGEGDDPRPYERIILTQD